MGGVVGDAVGLVVDGLIVGSDDVDGFVIGGVGLGLGVGVPVGAVAGTKG